MASSNRSVTDNRKTDFSRPDPRDFLNAMLYRRFHHHDPDQQAIQVDGHDLLINELSALSTEVFGFQQLFDKLVKLFLLPAQIKSQRGQANYASTSGTVIYKSKKTQRKSKGGRKNFEVFTAAQFIAAITQHIPEKSFQLVRYYGWYSNRSRGDREKRKLAATAVSHVDAPLEVEILDVSDYRPKKIPSPQWRECIKKVWEVDPLACPKCGCEMKIISFITEGGVIRKILGHLGKWEERAPVERAPPPAIRERRYEPVDDGWPEYEEPSIQVS